MSTYAPALIFIAIGATIGIVFGILNKFLGPTPRANSHKTDPYESGMPSEIKQGLYPIAVQLRAFGTFALLETITFIVLLLVGFGYVWRRGALTWK